MFQFVMIISSFFPNDLWKWFLSDLIAKNSNSDEPSVEVILKLVLWSPKLGFAEWSVDFLSFYTSDGFSRSYSEFNHWLVEKQTSHCSKAPSSHYSSTAILKVGFWILYINFVTEYCNIISEWRLKKILKNFERNQDFLIEEQFDKLGIRQGDLVQSS